MRKTKSTKYIIGTVVGLFAIRALRLAYHQSRLERFVESIIGGEEQTVELDQKLVDTFPKTSRDLKGRPTEALNLILIGSKAQIEAAFERAGWCGSVPITASNWARAFWAGALHRSYPTGPMTPYYISTAIQDLSFQQETAKHSFQQRHHVRFWQTNHQLKDGARLWLGMASYDRSLKLLSGWRFPYHHIDGDLDAERDYIVKALVERGGQAAGQYRLSEPREAVNDHGDKYFTDGLMKVVDLRGVQIAP